MTIYAASLSASGPIEARQSASEILDAGYEGIVLDAPVHHEAWLALCDLLPKDTVKAIRLFLPYPRALRRHEKAPFLAAGESQGDRSDALSQAGKTLEAVDQMGIPFVLIPMTGLGLTGLERRYLAPTASSDSEQMGRRLSHHEVSARMDSLLFLLSFLLEKAERYATRICLTPGNRPAELPLFSECLACLEEFEGAPLGLWLDTCRLPTELLRVPSIGEPEGPGPGFDLFNKVEGASICDEDEEGAPCDPGQGVVPWDQVASTLRGLPLWCIGSDLEEGRRFLDSLVEDEKPPAGIFDA